MCYNAIDIAKKVIAYTNEEEGDSITNLKLQKLLYYLQGFHLAFYNKPLFKEHIRAWTYGPVVEEVYQEFKGYGSQTIYKKDVKDELTLDEEAQNVFESVYEVYSKFSAIKLMEMTHAESPWRNTEIQKIITHEKMKKFFKTRIE